MLYHTQTADEVVQQLGSNQKGLHQIYAESRLSEHGGNHLRISRRSLWRILMEPFAHVLMLILLAACAASLLLGQIIEAILIAVIILLTAVAAYYQHILREYTLRSLERQAIGTVRVRRDGIEASVDAVELVPGDIVLLAVGELVPADGRMLHSAQLYSNQLQLTGEPEPVAKHSRPLHSDTPLQERHNMVYRGSYITSGTGSYIVTATGNQTEYGKLLQRAARITRRSALLQKIDDLLYKIIAAVLALATLLLAIAIWHGMQPQEALEYAVTLIVATVPAALMVVLASTITAHIRGMRRYHALVRNPQTIEPISMISTVLSDKTGILTHDELAVVATWHTEHIKIGQLAAVARSASLPAGYGHDAVDHAINKYFPASRELKSVRPLQTFSFDHSIAMSGCVWHHGSQYELALKGAPEKILRLVALSENERERILHEVHRYASEGHQVIAVAHAITSEPITRLSKLPRHSNLEFVGLIVCAQTLRKDAKQAIHHAVQAGITLRMITGDHIETAYSIASQLGIATNREEVLDARKLTVMSDSELGRVIAHTKVIARVTPDQKHRIITALRRQHIVAVTGHGADDIPALIQSHIGVSSASSALLARDASDVILLDNSFSTLFTTIKWARTAIGNIRRVFFYLMTTNVAEMLLISGSLLISAVPALLSVQLLWINIVTSACLALPLGLEPHSRHIMKRRPVSPRAPILPAYLLVRLLAMATVMASITLGGFAYYTQLHGIAYAQTVACTMFIAMQVVGALSARSDHTSTLVRFRTFSPKIYLGIAAVLVLQWSLLFTPLGSWLGVQPVYISDALVSGLVASVALLITSELLKLYSRRFVRAAGRSYE